jgi:hypothetical protein
VRDRPCLLQPQNPPPLRFLPPLLIPSSPLLPIFPLASSLSSALTRLSFVHPLLASILAAAPPGTQLSMASIQDLALGKEKMEELAVPTGRRHGKSQSSFVSASLCCNLRRAAHLMTSWELGLRQHLYLRCRQPDEECFEQARRYGGGSRREEGAALSPCSRFYRTLGLPRWKAERSRL